jgi:ubiquinone/menaquinone biosynthesis C-methylase UbiE
MPKKRITNTIKWYNKNAQKFADAIEKYTDPDQFPPFIKLLPSNAKVLDAGCGTGRDSQVLKSNGLNPIGLDLSTSMIQLAKSKYPGIEFIEGDLLHLPFDKATFDGVWAHASLLHLKDIHSVTRALTEFSRVLKKGGILHIFLRANAGGNKASLVFDPSSNLKRWFQKYSTADVQAALKASGFLELETVQYNELARHPDGGRPDVEWIVSLSQKP